MDEETDQDLPPEDQDMMDMVMEDLDTVDITLSIKAQIHSRKERPQEDERNPGARIMIDHVHQAKLVTK